MANRPPGDIPVDRSSTDLAAELCVALRPLLAQAAARDICLLIQPAADFPDRVRADGLKITWAVTTLVGNALRYVRAGSRMLPGGIVRVEISWNAACREAVLAVIDDGSGIAPDALRSLLSREKRQGTTPSLALILIEDIVHAHGGSLEITSSQGFPNGSTTVKLTIPCPE